MMPGDDLSRWETLIEREAEGEALSADERVFVERYASEHPEAGEELRVLRGLSGALAAPRAAEPGDRELIAQVFAQGQALERARRGRLLLAGGVALAAGLALWLARPGSAPPAPQVAAAPSLPVVRAVLDTLSPEVTVDGQSAAAGAVLGQGQRIETRGASACIGLEHDARFCLGPGSLARLTSLSGELLVTLERGALAAELGPQVVGRSFSVQSSSYTVRAIGTRFGVEMLQAGVQLNVLSGIVEVRGAGEPYRVSAPAHTRLGTGRLEALGPESRQAVESLLAPALAGVLQPAEPVGPSSPAVPERASSAQPPPAASAETAGTLLARAREERAAGAMKDAARAYRRLLGEHPASAEAHTARVALGQLELSSLGDPAGALGHFSEYLRRGGPLEQEARYGQVRALAALGRAAEEKQAIEAFLAKHPKAMQAAALKERLKTLSGAGATMKR